MIFDGLNTLNEAISLSCQKIRRRVLNDFHVNGN